MYSVTLTFAIESSKPFAFGGQSLGHRAGQHSCNTEFMFRKTTDLHFLIVQNV